MAKRKKTSPASSHTAAPAKATKQPASDSGRGFPVSFAIRLGVAVVLVLFVWSGVGFAWNGMWADTTSQRGYNSAVRSDTRRIGLEKLRRAYEDAPWDPVNKFRLANTIITIESQRLAAEGWQRMDIEDLLEAVDLLSDSRNARYKPHLIDLQLAQAEAAVAEYYRQRGDQEQMREFSNLAAEAYLEYRNVQGQPDIEMQKLYPPAMEQAFVEPRPQLALIFYEDFHHYDREAAETNGRLADVLLDSRYLMGEFHLLFSDLFQRLHRDPADPELVERLKRYGERTGQDYMAVLGLRELDRVGRVPASLERYYQLLDRRYPANPAL